MQTVTRQEPCGACKAPLEFDEEPGAASTEVQCYSCLKVCHFPTQTKKEPTQCNPSNVTSLAAATLPPHKQEKADIAVVTKEHSIAHNTNIPPTVQQAHCPACQAQLEFDDFPGADGLVEVSCWQCSKTSKLPSLQLKKKHQQPNTRNHLPTNNHQNIQKQQPQVLIRHPCETCQHVIEFHPRPGPDGVTPLRCPSCNAISRHRNTGPKPVTPASNVKSMRTLPQLLLTTINGIPLSASDRALLLSLNATPPPGHLWYNRLDGTWGFWGAPVQGRIQPGLHLGGGNLPGGTPPGFRLNPTPPAHTPTAPHQLHSPLVNDANVVVVKPSAKPAPFQHAYSLPATQQAAYMHTLAAPVPHAATLVHTYSAPPTVMVAPTPHEVWPPPSSQITTNVLNSITNALMGVSLAGRTRLQTQQQQVLVPVQRPSAVVMVPPATAPAAGGMVVQRPSVLYQPHKMNKYQQQQQQRYQLMLQQQQHQQQQQLQQQQQQQQDQLQQSLDDYMQSFQGQDQDQQGNHLQDGSNRVNDGSQQQQEAYEPQYEMATYSEEGMTYVEGGSYDAGLVDASSSYETATFDSASYDTSYDMSACADTSSFYMSTVDTSSFDMSTADTSSFDFSSLSCS